MLPINRTASGVRSPLAPARGRKGNQRGLTYGHSDARPWFPGSGVCRLLERWSLCRVFLQIRGRKLLCGGHRPGGCIAWPGNSSFVQWRKSPRPSPGCCSPQRGPQLSDQHASWISAPFAPQTGTGLLHRPRRVQPHTPAGAAGLWATLTLHPPGQHSLLRGVRLGRLLRRMKSYTGLDRIQQA